MGKDILEKAIRKALDAGWRPLWGPVGPDRIELNRYTVVLSRDDKSHEYAHEEILFNHDFAKALWGTEEGYDHYGGPVEFYDFGGEDWQYHLMCMVIADDPVKYLGENI